MTPRAPAEAPKPPPKKRSGLWKWVLGIPVAGASIVLAIGAMTNKTSDTVAFAKAESAVKDQLKDPGSATFDGLFIAKEKSAKGNWLDVGVCGYVNAKNSFGSYSGKTRFVAVQMHDESSVTSMFAALENDDVRTAAPSSVDVPPPSIFEKLWWNERCVDATHPATYTGVSARAR